MAWRKSIPFFCVSFVVSASAVACALAFGYLSHGYFEWASFKEARENENMQLSAQNATLLQRIAENEQRVADGHEELAARNAEIAAAEVRLAGLKKNEEACAALLGELKKNAEENSRLKGNSASLTEQIAEKTADLEALKSEMEKMRTQVGNVQLEIEKTCRKIVAFSRCKLRLRQKKLRNKRTSRRKHKT